MAAFEEHGGANRERAGIRKIVLRGRREGGEAIATTAASPDTLVRRARLRPRGSKSTATGVQIEAISRRHASANHKTARSRWPFAIGVVPSSKHTHTGTSIFVPDRIAGESCSWLLHGYLSTANSHQRRDFQAAQEPQQPGDSGGAGAWSPSSPSQLMDRNSAG